MFHRRRSTRYERNASNFYILFFLSTTAMDVQSTNDSWLEKDNFERMFAQQPELLRAEVLKKLNECRVLKENARIMEDTKRDLLVRN